MGGLSQKYKISELAQPSEIPQRFPVDDANWTLGLWKAMLSQAIFLKGQMWGDNVSTFYTNPLG